MKLCLQCRPKWWRVWQCAWSIRPAWRLYRGAEHAMAGVLLIGGQTKMRGSEGSAWVAGARLNEPRRATAMRPWEEPNIWRRREPWVGPTNHNIYKFPRQFISLTSNIFQQLYKLIEYIPFSDGSMTVLWPRIITAKNGKKDIKSIAIMILWRNLDYKVKQ